MPGLSVLSYEQIAAVARQAGWPADAAPVAVALTVPESSREPGAIQQGVPYSQQGWGLWQITPGNSVPAFGINQQLLDPLNNAKAALFKWNFALGFEPWTTYTHNLYEPYLAQATAAVATVYHLNAAQLAAAVAAARTYGPTLLTTTPRASDWSSHVARTARTTTASAGRTEAHARAVAALNARWRPPAVRPPSAGSVLIQPRRI